jgi:hypothetical protein
VQNQRRQLFMSPENPNVHEPDENRDPLSGEPGSHPVGTGIGATALGVAGAVVGGILGGPPGAAVGTVVGPLVGGLAGKGVAESINPTAEDAYWRENYASRPYAEQGRAYEHYQPAYRLGYEAYGRHADSGRTYEQVEPELRTEYETNYGASGLPWERAQHATRDAWGKLHQERLVSDKDRAGTIDAPPPIL